MLRSRASLLLLLACLFLLSACGGTAATAVPTGTSGTSSQGTTPTDTTGTTGGTSPTDTAGTSAVSTTAPSDTAGTTATTATTGASGSGAPVQITILSNFTPDVARGKVFNDLISQFNQQHSGHIQVISNPDPDWPTLQQKIKTMISAGSPPDVFLYNYNANDLSRENSGELMDWSQYLNSDSAWKARFRPENLQAVTANNQIVGIPGDQAPVLFYYHKDVFTKAGITNFGTTSDEFFKDADKIKASGVAPIALMTADDAWYSMNAFSYLTTAAGGTTVFDVNQPLNSSAVISGATYLKQLYGYTTADAIGANYSVASNNFLTGKAAMDIDGPWLISSIQKQQNPCEVGVAVAPTFGDNKVPAGYIVTDSLNVWAAAKQTDKNKEQAIVEWMKFFTSDASAKTMSVQGEYPLAIKTTLSQTDISKASCQMGQVLQLSNAAPAAVVEAVRNIKTAAQAQLPSLLESLALGQTSPQDFANQLQGFNK